MKRKARVASSRAVEFLPSRFFFVALRETERVTLHHQQPSASTSEASEASGCALPRSRALPATPGVRSISLDDHLAVAEALSAGTRLDLRDTIRFCDFLTSFVSDAEVSGSARGGSAAATAASKASESKRTARVHFFYLRSSRVETETRVIHLICRWRLLHLRLAPAEAAAPFEHLPFLFPTMAAPLSSARAARRQASPVNLLVSLQGLAKALRTELLDSAAAPTGLDALRLLVDQQQRQDLEAPECGAMLWVTKRLVVLAAPLSTETQSPSSSADTADDDDAAATSDSAAASADSVDARAAATRHLVAMLKRHRVTSVVRLHRRKLLDDSQLAASGIDVADLVLPPPAAEVAPPPPATEGDDSLSHFLRALEAALASTDAAVVAVDAAAGSGTAAALVGCYLMKHLEFSSREAFGWLHACQLDGLAHRHQLLLDRQQRRMWRDGAVFRRQACDDAESDAHLLRAAPLHVNIGNIALGRHSLFGTKANGHAPASVTVQASTSREPHAPAAARPDPEQLRRRPVTQGSVGRRPRGHMSHHHRESAHLRADFAQMHKFLHQTGSVGSLSTPRAPRAQEVASESLGS